MYRNIILSLIIVNVAFLSSCSQEDNLNADSEPKTVVNDHKTKKYSEPHAYGGWFCPDNFGGFPPMDIHNIDDLEVVKDRLPTKEETRNGKSLIHVDVEKYPDARPLDISLPRRARIYSQHNDINELIIVIQAVVVGKDTIVGYRYPNGGNGSAWYGQVSFLDESETTSIRPSPFVYYDVEIKATKEQIWKAITQTSYARELGNKFLQTAFFLSDWTEESRAHLNFESEDERAAGIVTMLYGNLYMQIDYDKKGFHYAEKLLISEPQDKDYSELHIVAGPFPNDYGIQQNSWKKWLDEVKATSEKE